MSSQSNFNTTVLRSILWIAGSSYMMTAVGFVGNLLLARLLSPTEFGVFALAASVLVLVYILSGFGAQEAIVQYRGKNPEQVVATAFWISVAIGALLAVLGVLLGVGARYFGYFDVTVTRLMIALALVYFGGVFVNTIAALLQRDLNHRPIAIVDAISKTLSFVLAVIVAWRGGGVWALFVRESAEIGFRIIGMLWVHPKLPRLQFDRDAAKWITDFGMRILYTRASEVAYGRVDNLVVERGFGSTVLGGYTMAYRLSQLGHQLTFQTIGSVMFSAFATVQASKERLRVGFERSTYWLVRLSLLVGLLAFAAGEALTVWLYGAEWRQAGQLLVSMTPFILILPLYENNRVLLEGIGQLNQTIQASVVKFVIFVGGLIVLPAMMGLAGVVLSVNLSVLIGWLALCYMVSQQLRIDWLRLLLRPVAAFLLAWLAVSSLPMGDGFGRIVPAIFTAMTTYLLSLLLFEYKLLSKELSVVRNIAFVKKDATLRPSQHHTE